MTEQYVDAPVRLNWNALRLMLRAKARKELKPGEDLSWVRVSGAAGINHRALTAFLCGERPTVTVDNLLPLLKWLEIYDWRKIADGEGCDDGSGE